MPRQARRAKRREATPSVAKLSQAKPTLETNQAMRSETILSKPTPSQASRRAKLSPFQKAAPRLRQQAPKQAKGNPKPRQANLKAAAHKMYPYIERDKKALDKAWKKPIDTSIRWFELPESATLNGSERLKNSREACGNLAQNYRWIRCESGWCVGRIYFSRLPPNRHISAPLGTRFQPLAVGSLLHSVPS